MSCFWGVMSYNFYISQMVILPLLKRRSEYYQKYYHRKNKVVKKSFGKSVKNNFLYSQNLVKSLKTPPKTRKKGYTEKKIAVGCAISF